MSQRQCLPIDEDESDSDSELNFDLEQMSAQKYLKSVRLERERTQEIVSVEVPKDFDAGNNVGEVKPLINRQFHTREWQEFQKEMFENLQRKICEIRNLDNEDRLLKELPMDLEDENDCIKYCQENEPLLSIILRINAEDFIEVLADHFEENVHEMKLKDLNDLSREFEWIAKWTYALIACLRIPLIPEAHHSIRVIAKCCIILVDHFTTSNDLAHDSHQLLPLSLLISIIKNNFHQHDLLSL